MTQLSMIIWIGVTLVFIAFFAGLEIAFVSSNRLNIELKKKQGRRSGIILSRFMEQPAAFIGTCLVGINIFLVVYGLLFSELMKSSLWNPLHFDNEYVKLAFDTFISTIIVLFLGEFIPKALFRARNDVLLNFFAPITLFFYRIFYPVASVFVKISEWILSNIFNVRVKENMEAFSKVDLEHFFQQTREQDEETSEISDINAELFENALSLPQVKIRQCLVPRTEIEAVELSATVEQVRNIFIETKLSKLVVYQENVDNIVGYVHQLDLFKRPPTIKSILLPIPPVPESMSATDLISKFSRERKSIAWVVDEFGGTAGIVTMEDVLEEIFGEIRDEYDTEDLLDKRLSENEYILSGRLELDYLNEKYGFRFPVHESETLSGYLINHHESIPRPRERIIIDQYEFDVLNVSDTRIEMVKMKILR